MCFPSHQRAVLGAELDDFGFVVLRARGTPCGCARWRRVLLPPRVFIFMSILLWSRLRALEAERKLDPLFFLKSSVSSGCSDRILKLLIWDIKVRPSSLDWES